MIWEYICRGISANADICVSRYGRIKLKVVVKALQQEVFCGPSHGGSCIFSLGWTLSDFSPFVHLKLWSKKLFSNKVKYEEFIGLSTSLKS